jgi:hypothetical protein
LGAAALFVFLAGTTGTRIIAANLGAATHYLLHWLRVSGSGHAGLIQFAAFFSLEGFFEFVH